MTLPVTSAARADEDGGGDGEGERDGCPDGEPVERAPGARPLGHDDDAAVDLDRLSVREERAQDERQLSRGRRGADAKPEAPDRLGAGHLPAVAGQELDALPFELELDRRGSGPELRQLDPQDGHLALLDDAGTHVDVPQSGFC